MQRGCRLYSHMAQRWTSLTARMQVCSTHWIHDLADFVRYAYRSRLAQAGMLQTGLTHNRNVARFTSTTLIISKLAAVTATPYEWATFVLCGNARQLALGNDTSTPLMPLDQWTDILMVTTMVPLLRNASSCVLPQHFPTCTQHPATRAINHALLTAHHFTRCHRRGFSANRMPLPAYIDADDDTKAMWRYLQTAVVISWHSYSLGGGEATTGDRRQRGKECGRAAGGHVDSWCDVWPVL